MLSSCSPFDGWDVRTLVDAQAAVRGDHVFIAWEPLEGSGRTWTFREFGEALRRFAAGLHARGVAVGDRVLVHLDNCPEAVIAWLGCAYAGAIAVTTNTKSTADELAYFAGHSEPVGGVTQPCYAGLVQASLPISAWRVCTDHDAGAPAATPDGFEAFSSLDGDPAGLSPRPHDPEAAFAIQYTSGTTSRPKAVLWSHGNALWGARMTAAAQALTPDDVSLAHLPLFHTNAQVYSALACLWSGATLVVTPRFSASRFWPVALKWGVTYSSMIPFCVKALLTRPVPEGHKMRLWGNGVCDAPWDQHFGFRTLGHWA